MKTLHDNFFVELSKDLDRGQTIQPEEMTTKDMDYVKHAEAIELIVMRQMNRWHSMKRELACNPPTLWLIQKLIL